MTKASKASSPGLPPMDFWEDRLEIRADLLAGYRTPGQIAKWVSGRSGQEVAVLRALVGLPHDALRKDWKADLLRYEDELRRFVPVSVFGLYKSKAATVEVAKGCVDQDLRRLAETAAGESDKSALLYAIYDHSVDELERVFLLDKLHRVGFARMKLSGARHVPKRSLIDFLRSDDLGEVLERFDRDQRDKRRCQLRAVFEREDGLLVYIRRPHRHGQLLIEDRLRHGHSADWIVLEFQQEGRFLNVASHGKKASFAIADRIASTFYGRSCGYLNIEKVAYAAQLQTFLERLASNEAHELVMVGFGLREPPLPALDDLGGSNRADLSVGPSILELQRLLGEPLLDGDHLEHLKVIYRDKRVPLRIDRLDDAGPRNRRRYVVRYRDQSLNLAERTRFEELIRRNYGFEIVSTEKNRVRAR